MAEWLRNGLQNRVPRFNSGRGLQYLVGIGRAFCSSFCRLRSLFELGDGGQGDLAGAGQVHVEDCPHVAHTAAADGADLGRRTLGLGEPRYGSAAQIMERQAGNLGLAAGVGAR